MLALTVNDTQLDLDPGTTVSITMECPIFDREGIERTYSYPFSLPASPRNLVALGMINRVDAHAPVKVPAKLFIGGLQFETGILRITGSDKKTIKATFQNAAIDLLQELKSVKLQDIDMPVVLADPYCPDVTIGGTLPGGGNPFTNVAIKIDDVVYTGPKSDMSQIVDAINAVHPGLASVTFLTAAPPEGGFDGMTIHCIAGIDDIDVRIDFPDTLPANTELMTPKELSDDLTRLHNDIEAIIETGEFNDSLRFPTVLAPNLYNGENAGYRGYANYLAPDGTIDLVTFERNPDYSWPDTALPLPRLIWVLEQIGMHFGFTLSGSLLNVTELVDHAIVWINRPAENIVQQIHRPITNLGIGPTKILDSTIQVEDYLPESTVTEFLTRIINTFAAYMTYRQGVLRFQLVEPLLAGRPEDWTEYAEPDYNQTVQEDEGYSLDYERPKEEAEITGQLQRIDGGPNAAEFKPGFFTLYDRTIEDELEERTWMVPYTSEQGNSLAFNTNQETSFRLLLYRGAATDSVGNTYYLATHRRTDEEGNELGSYAIEWPGQGGLFESFWGRYIRMLTYGREVTKVMALPITEIIRLRSWDQIVKKIYSEHGEFTGVVKSVRFKVTTRSISLAEVTFQKTR